MVTSAGVERALTVKVHVAGHLKDYTNDAIDLELQKVGDVFDLVLRLNTRFPRFRERILDEHDRIRPYINVYVNEESVKELQGERTKVKDGDIIYILPSVAGGSQSD